MKRVFALTLFAQTLLAMAGCTDPQLGLGFTISPNGVAVRPTLTSTVGGVGVGVSGSLE